MQRCCRIASTGVGWLFFGAVILVLGFLVTPCQRFFHSPDPQRRVQVWINSGFRAFEWLLVRTGVIRVSWRGLEGLEAAPPRIYVANHPSLIDALLILSKLPYGDVVVAESYAKHWAMRALIRATGYLFTGLCSAQGRRACVK